MEDPERGPADPGEVLAAHLGRLDAAAATDLVADLWAARGYRVSRDGRVVTATRGGCRRRIGVTAARVRRPHLPPGCDTVVALGGPVEADAETAVVDADDLAAMVRYGVDRETSRALCERHLGAAPADLRPPVLTALARAVGTVLPAADSPGGRRLSPRLVLGLALVVTLTAGAVAGGTALLGGGVGGSGSPGPGSAADATVPVGPAAVPDPEPDEALAVGDDPDVDASFPPGAVASLPPGVTPAGVGDWGALTRAHEAAVDGSHRIVVQRQRAAPNGPTDTVDDDRYLIQAMLRPGVTRTSRITVADDRYLLEARVAADNRTVRTDVYHDGETWYVGSNLTGNATYRASGVIESAGPDPDALRRGLVQRYLTTPDSRVAGTVRRDGRVLYRIEGAGTPLAFPSSFTENYTVVALVDGDGLVHELTADYRLVDDESVRLTTTVTTDVGDYSVTAPDWFVDRNGTAVESQTGTVSDG